MYILQHLPNVQHLNLLDNRLSEVSIIPLTETFMKTDGIKSLDLSENSIGAAAEKIISYLTVRIVTYVYK